MSNYLIILLLFFFCSCKQSRKHTETINGTLYRYEYYENGIVKSKTPYIDSVREGIQYLMYPNGELMQSVSWIDNNKIGETIDYWNNGKPKKFDFYNVKSELIYERTYDTSGKLVYENGEIEPVTFTKTNKFIEEHLLFCDVYKIQPPNTKVSLTFFLIKGRDTLPILVKDEKIIHIRQKVRDISYDQFAVKMFVEDFDKLKKWDQMDILKLNGHF